MREEPAVVTATMPGIGIGEYGIRRSRRLRPHRRSQFPIRDSEGGLHIGHYPNGDHRILGDEAADGRDVSAGSILHPRGESIVRDGEPLRRKLAGVTRTRTAGPATWI